MNQIAVQAPRADRCCSALLAFGLLDAWTHRYDGLGWRAPIRSGTILTRAFSGRASTVSRHRPWVVAAPGTRCSSPVRASPVQSSSDSGAIFTKANRLPSADHTGPPGHAHLGEAQHEFARSAMHQIEAPTRGWFLSDFPFSILDPRQDKPDRAELQRASAARRFTNTSP